MINEIENIYNTNASPSCSGKTPCGSPSPKKIQPANLKSGGLLYYKGQRISATILKSQPNKKAIALAFIIKKLHTSGCIHNYTPKELSKQVGLSAPTVKKYINYLIAQDLAFIDSGNLTIKRLYNASEQFYRIKETTLKNIVKELNYILFINNIQSQKKAISFKDKVNKRNKDSDAENEKLDHKIRMSNNLIARIIGKSKSYARNFKKILKSEYKFVFFYECTLISNSSLSYLPSNCFTSRGRTYRVDCFVERGVFLL